MFSSIANVYAITDEHAQDVEDIMEDSLFYVISTLALWAGINISVNNKDAVMEYYEQCDTYIKSHYTEVVEYAYSGGGGGGHHRQDYYTTYEWSQEFISDCIHSIVSWFTPERFSNNNDDDGNTIILGEFGAMGGVINLSLQDSISFTFPSPGEYVPTKLQYHINSCNFCFYFNEPRWFYDGYVSAYWDTDHSSNYYCQSFFTIEPINTDFDLILVCPYDGSTGGYFSFCFPGLYYNMSFTYNSDYDHALTFYNIYDNSTFTLLKNYHFVSIGHNGRISICSDSSGRWGFSSDNGNTFYNNLTFDSYFHALSYFMGLCGLSFDGPVPYEPVDEPISIDIDVEQVEERTEQVDNMQDGDTVVLVLPHDDSHYTILSQNPSRVTDTNFSDVYNSPLSLPSSDGNILAQKFPFCLPFDVINLFRNFYAEPEAPQLHFCVMPENAFGMSNEAVYWDIDFTDYNLLVQLLRFFIALSFTIWLIVKTRHLIGE